MKARSTFQLKTPPAMPVRRLSPSRRSAFVLCLLVVLAPSAVFGQPVKLAHDQLHAYVANPTVTAVRSGRWSDGTIWSGGVVPGARAKVGIPFGITVTVDGEMAAELDWVNVDGTLRFDPNVSTSLVVDTLVAMGQLEMGTAAAPVRAEVTARLIIRSSGLPIDHRKDPLELSRGLIGMGPVSMHGASKTEIVSLASLPPAGATTLLLDADPAGWRVNDELLVAPTLYGQDEVVRVTSIAGRMVNFTPALKFTRTNVPPAALAAGAKIHVGNLTRNVIVATDAMHAGNAQLQGHVMLMGGGHRVYNATFKDVGRSLASRPVTDPILRPDGTRDPQVMPLCGAAEENVRGRYALHFHNPGPETPLSIVEGAVIRVQRNKGFKVGIQNHSANVAVRRVVVHQIDGSGIFTEEGNERGEIRGSLVVHSFGSNGSHPEFPRDTCSKEHYRSIHTNRRTDFGHRGNGIWLQGGQVEVVGNILAGQDNAGIEQNTASLTGFPSPSPLVPVTFPVKLLREGDWWVPPSYKQTGVITRMEMPPSVMTDNVIYAIGGPQRFSRKEAISLESGLHLEKWAPRPKNIIARTLVWNSVHCLDASYSSWTALTDITCIAGLPHLDPLRTIRRGVATRRQDGRYWDYTRVRIEGFSPNEAFKPSVDSTFKDVTIDGQPFVPTETCTTCGPKPAPEPKPKDPKPPQPKPEPQPKPDPQPKPKPEPGPSLPEQPWPKPTPGTKPSAPTRVRIVKG